MSENFDTSGLAERISKIKKEGEETTDFTIECLTCLMERHDLRYSIPDGFEVEDVPQVIFDTLRQGEIPSKEQVLLMDNNVQNSLIIELIWVCGMNAISYYTKEEDENSDYFDAVLSMLDVGPGHFIGCYITAALTLLMCKVPTIELVEVMTNNFDNSEEQLMKNQDVLIELAASIFMRWKEDKVYYQTITNPFEEV